MKILENGSIISASSAAISAEIDLSVVIVNWNTRDLLERCLKNATASLGSLQAEIIVIDNASIDNSTAMVRQGFSGLILIENLTNTGFSRANNQGIEISRGRYILLLNSDAFVEPDTFEKLVELMDANPDTGVAGCQLLNEDGTLQRSVFGFATLATELWQAIFLDRIFPRSKVFGAYRMTYWDMNDLREVDSVMGACMILRADAIRQVGGLDERYFMYSEEMDLCYRMKKAGWKVRYDPLARAVHLWGGSSQRIPRLTFLRLFRSRVLFFRKHYGRVTAWLYKLLLFGSSLIRSVAGQLVLWIRPSENLRDDTGNYATLLREVFKY